MKQTMLYDPIGGLLFALRPQQPPERCVPVEVTFELPPRKIVRWGWMAQTSDFLRSAWGYTTKEEALEFPPNISGIKLVRIEWEE